MNGYAILFLLFNAAALLWLPRRWAPLPLLIGACYMTAGQKIEIGPFNFTVLRLLLLIGAIRAVARTERLPGGINGLDRVVLMWGGWLLCSSVFHKPPMEALVFRLGAVYNVLGFYFLIRLFCRNTEDMIQILKITAVVLVPVALEMINEGITGRDFFSIFGGVPEVVEVRAGKFRAQGPFGHSILAGSVGAVCVPLFAGIWRIYPKMAKIGLCACLGMVVASKSSGPLMTVACGLFAVGLWRWRHLTRQMRIVAVAGYIVIDLLASRPAYYALLNRIDLTGSSTGWHRAELIKQAFDHLGEWWWAGTDYTRHWMPYGVSASPDHCDLTNQYLFYGVWGGLPLMFLFIFALWLAFRYVGQALRLHVKALFAERFLIWSIGAGLFSHAVTCVSVAYFEQSMMFLYLNLALIGSLHGTALVAASGDACSASDSGISESDVDPDRVSDLIPCRDSWNGRCVETISERYDLNRAPAAPDESNIE